LPLRHQGLQWFSNGHTYELSTFPLDLVFIWDSI
jgi:hypothetical protein